MSRKLVSKFQTMLGRWWFKMTQKLFFKKLWGKPLYREDLNYIWKPILLDRRSYFKPLIMLWIYVCNIKRLHHQVAKMRHFFLSSWLRKTDLSNALSLVRDLPRRMKKKGDTADAARPTLWLYMLCRRYSICIRNICLLYNYRVYNNLFWIFLIQM